MHRDDTHEIEQAGLTRSAAADAAGGGERTAASPPPLRRPRRVARVLALGLAAAATGAAISHGDWNASTASPAAPAGVGIAAADGGPANAAAIAAKVDPGLVDIDSTFSYQGAEGAGTGLVLTPDGEILTNNHVIEGATAIRVTDIGNGKTYSATVVGYDPSKDIAVLKLQHASNLQTVSLGNSASVQVGATVLGIGNAGGTGGTPSTAGGSITALGQSITAEEEIDSSSEQLSGLLETNAAIQPGDSGGPLVNAAGQVIGIDTAGSQNFDFVFQNSSTQAYAIPIDTARAVAEAVEAGRGSRTVHVGATAFVGVGVEPTADEQGFGFGGFGAPGSGGAANANGLLVTNVVTGEPAARAGLVDGDVITSFDGHPVASEQALSALLLVLHPGESVKIGWTTGGGATQTATITLASGPPA